MCGTESTESVSCRSQCDNCNFYLDDTTTTSGINKRVARETEGKGDRRGND
jgi:hypothetical protein